MPYLDGQDPRDSVKAEKRIRFLETEFNPPGVAIDRPMTASALAKASASYRIDPATDRVEVRRDHLSRILDSRQYAAVLDGHWMASVPTLDLDGQHLVHIGPKNGGPVWLDAPPSADGEPNQLQLWQALRNRFDPVAGRPVVRIPLVHE
jgi:hypothetical protein